MEIIPQVDMSKIKIKDSVYYYTVAKNPSDRKLRFVLEVYGVELKTAKPINIVTVYFAPVFKDSHLSIAHLAIHTVTGDKYSRSLKKLIYTNTKVWRIGE